MHRGMISFLDRYLYSLWKYIIDDYCAMIMLFLLMQSLFPRMVQFFASVEVGNQEGYFTANQKILVDSGTKSVGKSRSISLPLTFRLVYIWVSDICILWPLTIVFYTLCVSTTRKVHNNPFDLLSSWLFLLSVWHHICVIAHALNEVKTILEVRV